MAALPHLDTWGVQSPEAGCDLQEGEDAAGKGGFKAQKEAERKEGAGNRAAWNTLFMRPDTVAAAVAEHYGVSRAELLDREASGVHTNSPSYIVIPCT